MDPFAFSDRLISLYDDSPDEFLYIVSRRFGEHLRDAALSLLKIYQSMLSVLLIRGRFILITVALCPVAARGVNHLDVFEPAHFYRDIINSDGQIVCWPYRVPIPEFHAHLAYQDQFPLEWTEAHVRAFLLQALHPEAYYRTRFVPESTGALKARRFPTITHIIVLSGLHAFIHPPTLEHGNPLPADIPNDVWHRLHRRQAVITLLGSPGLADPASPAYHSEAENGWDDDTFRLDVLRRYYDTSVRERDSRATIIYGNLLLEVLRISIPDGASLAEALNITAQLKALGFIFLDHTPSPQFFPSPRELPAPFRNYSESTPSPSIAGPSLKVVEHPIR